MPAETPTQVIEFHQGDCCLIEAVVAYRSDFDRGDQVNVEIRVQGYVHRFWVPRTVLKRSPLRAGDTMKK